MKSPVIDQGPASREEDELQAAFTRLKKTAAEEVQSALKATETEAEIARESPPESVKSR